MNIESFIISYLLTALATTVGTTTVTIPVYGDVPETLPDQFVTVEMTGLNKQDKVSTATIAVQSWDTTRANAAALNDKVIAAMEAMISKDEISKCALDTAYNYTDLTRKKPRYQAVFSVVY